MNIVVRYLLSVIVAALILCALFLLMGSGLSRYEQYECQKWQAETKIYQGYYLTGWQAAQCAHYNVKIDAPVEK